MYYTKKDIADFLTLPIESVAIALGLDVVRHCCPCPRHLDSNPSMHFYSNTNRFFCFSCRQSGNVIDLVKLVLNVGFVDACDWLASLDANPASVHEQKDSCNPCNSCSNKKQDFDASKYVRYFEHPYLNKRASEFLFNERKLNPFVIERCRLTSWKQWLQIPYFDINGNLIDVQWRNLGSSGPRFRFPSGSHSTIYNLPILRYLSPSEDLYISEGCSDCWSLMSAGHKAIAIPSATLLNIAELRSQFENSHIRDINIHMYPDADEPGESLFNQLSKVFPVTRHQLPSGCKDYSNFFVQSFYHFIV